MCSSTATSDTNRLEGFTLQLQTPWKGEKDGLRPLSDLFYRHEFPRPLVVSNLQVWPALSAQASRKQQQQQQSDIKMQLQLYGNRHGGCGRF